LKGTKEKRRKGREKITRKKKAAARASATYISYDREGARLWRDRFNQETREKTARQEREEKRQRLQDRERERKREAKQGLWEAQREKEERGETKSQRERRFRIYNNNIYSAISL
jgi:hypothetical protein